MLHKESAVGEKFHLIVPELVSVRILKLSPLLIAMKENSWGGSPSTAAKPAVKYGQHSTNWVKSWRWKCKALMANNLELLAPMKQLTESTARNYSSARPTKIEKLVVPMNECTIRILQV